MLLSTLKPIVGCLPSSSSGSQGSRVNVPPATMLRVNPKISSSSHALQERGKEERLQAKETRSGVSRRDVMCIVAASGVAISLSTKPVEAVEVANNAGNPISQFLELLKDLGGGKTPNKPKSQGDEPKTDGNDEKKTPVDNKAEPPKPKTGNGEAELSKPKTEGDAGKVKAETEAVGKN